MSIKNLLERDAIQEVEDLTGRKVKDSSKDGLTAIAVQMQISHEKKVLQKEMNDTTFSMKWVDWCSLLQDRGFDKVYSNLFSYDDRKEEEVIFFSKKYQCIIYCNSYNNSRNKSECYINACYSKEDKVKIGSFGSGSWIGEGFNLQSFDARESLFYRLDSVLEVASFSCLTKDHFLWFVNYVEEKIENYDYKSISKRKINLLPKEVQEFINL